MCNVHRVWLTLLLIVTVAVIGSAGYVVLRHDNVPNAGAMPGYSAAPTDPPSGSGTSSTDSAAPIRTVFLGDDYTNGTGASAGSKPWTAQVADALHLDAHVVAEDNAGYATPGIDGTDYLSLVPQVVAAAPDLVVVSGGRNDVSQAPGVLNSAAQRLFARLHARLPAATLVAVAPFWGDSAHPAKLAKVDHAVRAAVTAVNGTYLDVTDPLVGHRKLMADDADPNSAGYAKIAEAIIPLLRPQLTR